MSLPLRGIWTRMFGSTTISTGLRLTSNQQLNTRHSIKTKPIQSNKLKSQGQRESVSIGTGITDLGGIGKTNSKQVYYIWRAIFTASTKRTQKVLHLRYLSKTINNNPDMPNLFNNGRKTRLSGLSGLIGEISVHVWASGAAWWEDV